MLKQWSGYSQLLSNINYAFTRICGIVVSTRKAPTGLRRCRQPLDSLLNPEQNNLNHQLLLGFMVRALGLEPRTNALKGRCSTN